MLPTSQKRSPIRSVALHQTNYLCPLRPRKGLTRALLSLGCSAAAQITGQSMLSNIKAFAADAAYTDGMLRYCLFLSSPDASACAHALRPRALPRPAAQTARARSHM
jgi:hypothetical protein